MKLQMAQRASFGKMPLRLLFTVTFVAFAQHGTISGTVADASGDGVRKAIVTLTLHGPPRSWATERTDASGKFRFENLPAGAYDLRANKPGFGNAIYGARSVRELGKTITLDDGASIGDLKLRLLRASSISGHVLDPQGDPVIGASVALLRPARNLGERVLQNIRQAVSNDRGEYHMPGVDPGQYYLRVITNLQPVPGTEALLAGQFYGGATQHKDATLLTIRDGENASGLDFRLVAVEGVKVRGHVAVPETGNHPQQGKLQQWTQVSLVPLDDALSAWRPTVAANPVDGKFEMPEVPPGRYRIQARNEIEGRAYSGWQNVDAQPGIGEVTLTLAPAISVKGRLTIDGPSGQKPADFRITLRSATEQRWANPGADGAFEVTQVAAGEWEMNLNPVPRGGYIKSVLLGDKDVRFRKLLIEPGSDAPLNIVISMHTASIEGDVGPKRAGILLAPVGEFHDLARFYYAVMSDDAGKFRMLGIAPGKYRVFALENMNAGSFRSPEAADQLGELGEEIELAEGSHVTVHPKLIPAERALEALP